MTGDQEKLAEEQDQADKPRARRWGWKWWLAGLLPAVAIAGLLAFNAAYNTPCMEEDGSSQFVCRWDAWAQGDGNGASYILIGYGRFTITV